MRFYILPTDQGRTTAINFDHVASITIAEKTIEVYFIGIEAPMVIPKNPANINTISKGMDLSDAVKENVAKL